jgi:hypothetical protein
MANIATAPKVEVKKAKTVKQVKSTVEMPEIKNVDGSLKNLGRKHFPRNKEGLMAFLDYRIERLKEKRAKLTTAKSPEQRLADSVIRQCEKKGLGLEAIIGLLTEKLSK